MLLKEIQNLSNYRSHGDGAGDGAGAGAGGDGGKKPDPTWRDTLPDDLKNEPSLQLFADVGTLAKSYVHAQKAMGSDKIVKPSKHATPDDWKKVFKELGVPEEKDYKLEFADEEKGQLDEKFTAFFNQLAAKEQLFPDKAKKVLIESAKYIKQAETERIAAQKADQQKALDGLKNEWGAAFDIKSKQAELAFNTFGKDIEGFKEFLISSGLGNHPAAIKMFAAVGETLKEGRMIGKTPEGGTGALTPKEALQKANDILAGSQTHPYWDTQHPNHKNAVQELKELYDMAYPKN